MWFMHASLLRGWLPPTATIAAWAALAAGVGWSRRPGRHWIAIAAGAGALACVVAWTVATPRRVGGIYPRSFVVWCALPCFALGAAVWQWRVVPRWRRALALVAVPLLVVFSGLQINTHYGYFPTVGDVFGAPLAGQVDNNQFDSRAAIGVAGLRHATRNAVLSRAGVVVALDIPAPVSHFHHRKGYVWVPPIYFSTPRPELPVLMLLAGTPGSTTDWLRGGRALEVANSWAARHDGYAPIMVMPDANGSGIGDTECVDGPRGNAETYLTVDVPRFMEAKFGAAEDRHQWAVAGLSEGGTCALDLTARHPHRFATFGDFSGDAAPTLGIPRATLIGLYAGSRTAERAHNPTRWFRADAFLGIEGFLAVGSADQSHVAVEANLALAARRDRLHVHVDILHGDGHNFYTWAQALRDAYPWLVARLPDDDSKPNAHVVETRFTIIAGR